MRNNDISSRQAVARFCEALGEKTHTRVEVDALSGLGRVQVITYTDLEIGKIEGIARPIFAEVREAVECNVERIEGGCIRIEFYADSFNF